MRLLSWFALPLGLLLAGFWWLVRPSVEAGTPPVPVSTASRAAVSREEDAAPVAMEPSSGERGPLVPSRAPESAPTPSATALVPLESVPLEPGDAQLHLLTQRLLQARDWKEKRAALGDLVQLGMQGDERAFQIVVDDLGSPLCAPPGPPFLGVVTGPRGAESEPSEEEEEGPAQDQPATIDRFRCLAAWSLLAGVQNSPAVHRFAREQIESALAREAYDAADLGRYHDLMARNGGYEAACLLLEHTAGSEELRKAAVGAIAFLADHTLFDQFLARVHDETLPADDRSAIVHSLGEWNDPELEARLCELAFDERVEAAVRGILLDGLGQHWDGATLARSVGIFRALAAGGAEGATLRSKLMTAWTRVRPDLVREHGEALATIAFEELTLSPPSRLVFRTLALLEIFEPLQTAPIMDVVRQVAQEGPSPGREQAAAWLSRIEGQAEGSVPAATAAPAGADEH